MDTNLLPKEQKQVIAKVGLDLNISAQRIAEILGVNRTTVYRYAEQPTPEDLQQFATEIRGLIFVKQQMVLAELLKNIQDMASQASELKDIAIAYGIIHKCQISPPVEEKKAVRILNIGSGETREIPIE